MLCQVVTFIFENSLNSLVEKLTSEKREYSNELVLFNECVRQKIVQLQSQFYGFNGNPKLKKLKHIKGILNDNEDLGELLDKINNNDINTLRRISAVIGSVQEAIKKINAKIVLINEYIKYFGVCKANKEIPNVMKFFKILISIEEPKNINRIFGTVISFCSGIKAKTSRNKVTIEALTKYYNNDGTFKFNQDIQEYKRLMQELLIDKKDVKALPIISDMIDQFSRLLEESNQEKLKDNPRIYLDRYFDFNERKFIEIPDNEEEFFKYLRNSSFHTQEVEIRKLLVEAKQLLEKQAIAGRFTEQEYQLISVARYLLKSLSKGEAGNLKYILEKIDYAFSELDNFETKTSEEIERCIEKLHRLIASLEEICQPYNQNVVVETEERPNRFIFLLAPKDNPFVELDIKEHDKSLRKSFVDILKNRIITSGNGKLNAVQPFNPEYPLFYIANKGICVAFIKLGNNYLIVGASKFEKRRLHQLASRLNDNIAQIKPIMKASPEEFKVLLKDHSIYSEKLFSSKENGPKKRKRS